MSSLRVPVAAVSAEIREVDWSRVGQRVAIATILLMAGLTLWKDAHSGVFGFDFHGGAWKAGQQLLKGRSPYVRSDVAYLLAVKNAFVTPPVLAMLAVPFSMLPFGVAIVIWTAASASSFAGGLWLLGVRDWRIYALAFSSFPLVDSLNMGQVDPFLFLAAALAWRYRQRWIGHAAVGGMIAAKLFAWPLVIWLLAKRGLRAAATATACAVGLLLFSWALIDFQGFASYPRLLVADARAFEAWQFSNSVIGAAVRLGASGQASTAIAVGFALLMAVMVLALARFEEGGWFAAAIALGLLSSPILWPHYLLLIFVPVAISRPRSVGPWLLALTLWIGASRAPTELRATITIATAAAVVLWSATATASLRPAAASTAGRIPGSARGRWGIAAAPGRR